MDFIGGVRLGIIVRIEGGFVGTWRRVWPCARLWEHACPAGGYSSMKKSRQKIFRPSWWSPNGGAKSPEGDSLYAYPAGAYFSMKKSRQKSFRAPP